MLIGLGNGEGWNLMTSGKRKKAPAPRAYLQLKNRFSTLAADEGLGTLSNEASELAKPEPCSSTRRKWQVIIAGGDAVGVGLT